MKKNFLMQQIAARAFNQPAVRQQWDFYMGMFGPVLAPAYADDLAARVHIINILNKIGRRDSQGAQTTMATLKRSCGCEGEPEMALWHFMLGLLADATGDPASMAAEYSEAICHGAKFYLLHQKVAQQYQRTSRVDLAREHYLAALDCLPGTANEDAIRAAILSNLAICHSMLGALPEAHDALTKADSLTGALPGGWAIYHAANKNEAEALRYCEGADPALVSLVRTLLEDEGEDWDDEEDE